jgi:hypothetical protein
MKIEISSDGATQGAPAPRAGPHTVLTGIVCNMSGIRDRSQPLSFGITAFSLKQVGKVDETKCRCDMVG